VNAPAPEPLWWENPLTDWNHGDAARVAEVLAVAYPDAAAMHRLAGAAGVVVARRWRGSRPG
jgi:hypothetical protein